MRGGGRKFKSEVRGDLKGAFAKLRHRVERAHDDAIERIMIRLTNLVLERTPVWEGTLLANWRWSVDRIDNTIFQPEGTSSPPGPADWGRENRRGANEDKVRQSLAQVLRVKGKGKRVFYFSNPTKMAIPLEYDILTPAGRDARGMLGKSIAQVRIGG